MLALAVGAWSRTLWRRRRLACDIKRYTTLVDSMEREDKQLAEGGMDKGYWTGFQYFLITRREAEAEGIVSFYLRPYLECSPPAFLPGQFLTFRFYQRDESEPIIRCYSLSRAHDTDRDYKITVKHLPPPADAEPGTPWGRSSSYLYEHVWEGSVVEVAPPAGRFTLNLANGSPVVFIAGGIGITPFLAMVEHLIAHEPNREAWLFHGVQYERERLMANHLSNWTEEANFRYVTCYGAPGQPGRPLDENEEKGFVTGALLRQRLPSCNYEYYICGPAPMITEMMSVLGDWGVPSKSIHVEAFSSETVQQVGLANLEESESCEVSFRSARKRLQWTPDAGTILDLAQQNAIHLPFGCRAGNCGTCATPVLRGSFRYIFKPEAPVVEGYCLICISVPDGSIELA